MCGTVLRGIRPASNPAGHVPVFRLGRKLAARRHLPRLYLSYGAKILDAPTVYLQYFDPKNPPIADGNPFDDPIITIYLEPPRLRNVLPRDRERRLTACRAAFEILLLQ